MVTRRLYSGVLATLLSVCGLPAQEIRHLGLQLRGSVPADNLAEATGRKVGLGASLQAEMDLEEGYRWRVALGADRWGPGPWSGRPGVRGTLDATYLELEGIRLLRADTEKDLLGPYLLAGVRFVGWNLGRTDGAADLNTSRKTTHVAGSLGFGYRFTPWLDLELKTFYGKVDPDFAGGAASLGLTLRF
jgi:hypothetical protein